MPFEIDQEKRRKQFEKLNQQSSLEHRFAEQNREELEALVAQYAPPVVTIPQCETCNHPYRLWIEQQVLKGRSYSAIARSLPPDEEGHKLDRRSISNHAKEHMALDQAVIRAEMEEEAELLGQNIEEGVKGAFTNRGALKTLIHRAFEDAMAGVTTVEPRDLIQMIKLYNEMESNVSLQATEESKMAVRIMRDAVENVLNELLPEEQAKEIKAAIVVEIRRLRSLDDIEVEVERNFKALAAGHSD
jgi:hypothetical protein